MIQLDKVTKRHGSQILYVDACMAVFRGERIGLVGPNGAGKSTIFRLMVGDEQPDAGQVVVDRGISIGFFDQNVGEMAGRTALEEAISGAGEVAQCRAELTELETKLASADPDALDALVERFGVVQGRFDELGGYALEARAEEVLVGLGFSPTMIHGDSGLLSGGFKMRVALAKVLLQKPDLLLLDEPTNHLDIESIIWLEDFLKRFEGGLVITSHDRAFLNRVVNRIADIDGGELTTYTGDYDFYEKQWAERRAEQLAQFERQQAMLAKEQAFIDRFKARASHAAQVQSRVKKLEKIEKIEPPRERKIIEFEFREPPRSGEDVASLNRIDKAYGERKLYQDFELLIRRRERWCVMGINGAGKSTLLKMIAGTTNPDRGEVRLGASVKMGYFAQHSMELLPRDVRVLEAVQATFPNAGLGVVRNLLGAFGFGGDSVEKKTNILSGGEKARLVLALMLFDPPNFLVLDEPTNHLDLDTKKMLVNALRAFEGTMIFVSHDRAFLSALSNRTLELSDGQARKYGGGYDEYVAEVGYEAPLLRH
jgi:ATPase subunit of ABC transporter with duplicated ATPase domains